MEQVGLIYKHSNQYYFNKIVQEKTIQESEVLLKLRETENNKDEFYDYVKKKKSLLNQKLENGEIKENPPIGAVSMTQTEWKRLLEKVDKTIEEVKKEQKIKKQIQQKKILEKVEREKKRREEKRLKEEYEQEIEEKELLEQRVLALIKENKY